MSVKKSTLKKIIGEWLNAHPIQGETYEIKKIHTEMDDFFGEELLQIDVDVKATFDITNDFSVTKANKIHFLYNVDRTELWDGEYHFLV